MDLHVNYESIEPFDLERHDYIETSIDNLARAKHQNGLFRPEVASAEDYERLRERKIKPKLRADKTRNLIEIDTDTILAGVPAIAWEYKLGNRSAIEWILDQYKEKTPQDATVRERFNNYRFADYKEQTIDLLKRATTVSVERMKIIEQMPAAQ